MKTFKEFTNKNLNEKEEDYLDNPKNYEILGIKWFGEDFGVIKLKYKKYKTLVLNFDAKINN